MDNSLLIHALSNLPNFIHGKETFNAVHEALNPFTDGQVTLVTNEEEYPFHIEIKQIHRKESLKSLVPYARANTLLICNTLSSFLADFCSDHAINFIDESGNARVKSGGLNLWVEGKQHTDNLPLKVVKGKPGLGVMKLLFAILADTEILHLPYRDIASLANISLGMVNKGLQYLASENMISLGAKRRILDQEALYRFWIEYYRTVLRPKLGGIRIDAPNDWQDIVLSEGDYWGGEAAADALTHYIKPYELQLYTFEPLQKKLAMLNAKPNREGRLWLIPAFWGKDLKINKTAEALLTVAELAASHDSRNMEVARKINGRYLHLEDPFTPRI